MAYRTGLAQDTTTASGLATIMGVISAETRHLTWVNSGTLAGDPFVGPSDTVYPYATPILSNTKQFIVPGSCPPENPTYPVRDQFLPKLTRANTSVVAQGGHVDLASQTRRTATTSRPRSTKVMR
jgi:hypothetical protein